MIIESLLNFIYKIFSVLLSPFHIPSFGSSTVSDVNGTLDYIFTLTEDFIGLLLPWKLIKTCLGIILIIFAVIEGYKFIMWILKKIPMLGIS